MSYLLSFISGAITGLILCNYKDIIIKKIYKFKKLNDIVSSILQKGKLKSVWISCKIIETSLMDKINFQSNKFIVKKVENTKLYELEYSIHSQPYRNIIKLQRGPHSILSVMATPQEEKNEFDITDLIKKYAGPNRDFSGCNGYLTPKFLGMKKIIINWEDVKKTFEENDIIKD